MLSVSVGNSRFLTSEPGIYLTVTVQEENFPLPVCPCFFKINKHSLTLSPLSFLSGEFRAPGG